MDTRTFYDLVLPAQGRRCIGYLNQGGFKNAFVSDNGALVDALGKMSARPGNTYYALGGYGDGDNRKATNVVAVRSFWVDIDTQEGKPKEKYTGRKEAISQIGKFCEELALPLPAIVSSGYGIHAYWPMSEDISPSEWIIVATKLKAAAKQWGLAADPSRTSDIASVLRPIGLANRKPGRDDRQVKILKGAEPLSLVAFDSALSDYVGTDIPSLPGAPVAFAQNDDLIAKVTYKPSDANLVADNCAVVAEMRDTRGMLDQATWYGVLGVLAFTEQGEQVCHEWSNGHPQYSHQETAAKYTQARALSGATTCSKLSDTRDSVCRACPHYGHIKSPISLGVAGAVAEPIADADLPPPSVMASVPTAAFNYPNKFRAARAGEPPGIYKTVDEEVKDDAGNKVVVASYDVRVSDVLFYPTHRVKALDGTFSMNLMMRDSKNRTTTFLLDTGVVAEGGKSLFSELGRREISVEAKHRPDISQYLNGWISKLREDYDATLSVDQFGWVDKGFVLADRVITAQGPAKAVLSRSAAMKASHLTCSGSLEAWVSAVDTAYNRPGSEPFQFSVLCAFAAPLMRMILPAGGVFVHAHGHTGHGKSTSQFVGMSAWGNYSKLLLREGPMSTVNAMYQHFGVMRNLPIIVDEMTNCSNQFASELVYNTSAGTGKKRLNQDGSERESYDWSTIVMGSSNNMISEKLALHRADAGAELSRIFEFKIDHTSNIPPAEANKLFPIFQDNYGYAGEAFITYVVNNYDAVKATVIAMREKFDDRVGIRQSERYWSALHACVLTALGICRKLELVQFDAAAMQNWIVAEVHNNRAILGSSVLDPMEQFADMLTDIFTGILVTVGEGNLATGSPVEIVKEPQGKTITGRSILSLGNSPEKLLINVAVAKEWCNTKRVSFKDVMDALVKNQCVDKDIKRYSLGKGTLKYSGLGGPVKVLELNPSAMRSVMGDQAIVQKITGIITGGRDSAVDAA